MIDYSKIKLVIWDLDDTFWKGTLNEEKPIPIEINMRLVRLLNDCGIVNSICSKNDYETAKNELENLGVWEEFVFPVISWSPKGEAVKTQISDMNLRSANVLFVDDNPSNRKEVLYYCPDIMVAAPEELLELYDFVEKNGKRDASRKRLNQYKVLEKKHEARDKMPSNEEFLLDSDIHVSIGTDCGEQFERIHEILMRTNQLNYTKNRASQEELRELLDDKDTDCGYVSAYDRYGDYGIVGFYACKNQKLIHFAFSCRTMSMGIEQYVYNLLGCPELEIVGDVAYAPEKGRETPWINQAKSRNASSRRELQENQVTQKGKFLLKGPCDMSSLLTYMSGSSFDTELSFVNEKTGVFIAAYNTTTHLVGAIKMSEQQKTRIINECPFTSDNYYSDKFLSEDYDAVLFSMFYDSKAGLYRRKSSAGADEIVAYGHYCYDLTDEANWAAYMDGSIFNANCRFTKDELIKFKDNYEYIGRITPEKAIENLTVVRKAMPQRTTLILMLGSELEHLGNTQLVYKDMHVYSKTLNDQIRKWTVDYDNVRLFEYGKYITSQEQYLNDIHHFSKPVYYKMAQDLIVMLSDLSPNAEIKKKSAIYATYTFIRQNSKIAKSLASFVHKVLDGKRGG